MFSIFTLIIDIIIYLDIFKIYGILDICCVFLYAINLTYQQYLITIKNISFYIVCSFFGLVSLITIFIINFDWIRQYEVIDCFSALLKTLPYTFLYAIINFIYYLIAYNFSFIHSEIINLFLNINQIIFDIIIKKSYDITYIIILIIFIFALISFFIYLEIIELKCCGLNKNTRRNILIRENIDKTEINENINKENEDKNVIKSESKNIELTEGYLVDLNNIPNRDSNL